MASRYGAKDKYPEAQKEDEIRNENIERFQEQKAALEPKTVKDDSIFSKLLRSIAILALAITLILAGITMFNSMDENAYFANRENFYQYGFICTLIYFVTAYWALRRKKQKNTN